MSGAGAGSSDREPPLGTPPDIRSLPRSYQQPIIQLGKALGLTVHEPGMCQGFALVSAMAGLAPDARLTSFLRRLDLFKQPTKNLLRKIKAAEAKIQGIIQNTTLFPRVQNYQEAFDRGIREPEGKGSISLEEKELFELKLWITNLALLQSPAKFEKVMPQYQTSQYKALNKEFLMLFAPKGVEANISKQHLMKFNTATDIVSWLSVIQEKSDTDPKKPISVLLDFNGHAISINYHPESHQWHFFDANQQLHVFNTEEAGLTLFAEKIRSGLFFDGENGTTYVNAAAMGNAEASELEALIEQSGVFWTAKDVDFIQKDSGESLLHQACRNGNIKTVQALIAAGASVNKADKNGLSSLMFAAIHGQAGTVSPLLEAGADANRATNDGRTALTFAAENGHLEIVAALIRAGADANQAMSDGSTALIKAAQNGHTQIVKTLMDAGADIHKADPRGWTALMLAAQKGHLEIVAALIRAGADADQATPHSRQTALMSAAQNGHAEIVRALIAAGADANQAMPDGRTALMLATQKGHLEIVQALLPHEATEGPSPTDTFNFLLIAAAAGGHTQTVRNLLADRDPTRDSIDGILPNKATPLMLAAQNGHLEIVTALIAAGAASAAVNQSMSNGQTALMSAAQNGHAEIVRALIAAGADANQAMPDGRTALMLAAQKGHLEIVAALIRAGADADQATPHSRQTALMSAAQNGHAEIVRALIAAGADANQAMRDGRTALMLAAENGYSEIVTALIRPGAGLNQAMRDGRTALMLAAENGHLEIVAALIAAGADANQATPHSRQTALKLAAHYGYPEIVAALIHAGADVNQAAYGGQTALILAVQAGHTQIARALLEAGAGVHFKTTNGSTAFSLAIDSKNSEMVQLLATLGPALRPKQTGKKQELLTLTTRHTKIALLLKMAWSGRPDVLNGGEQDTIKRHLDSTGIIAAWTKPNSVKCFNALTLCFQRAAGTTVHRAASEIQKSRKDTVTMFDKVLSKSGLNDAEKTAARTSFGEALNQSLI